MESYPNQARHGKGMRGHKDLMSHESSVPRTAAICFEAREECILAESEAFKNAEFEWTKMAQDDLRDLEEALRRSKVNGTSALPSLGANIFFSTSCTSPQHQLPLPFTRRTEAPK